MGNLTSEERSLGCLLGGAIGDAFGYEIEFMPLPDIKRRFGRDGLTEPVIHDGHYRISDDTQMSLLTADGVLLAYSRYHTKGIAADPIHYTYPKYRRWAELQGFSVEGKKISSWLFSYPAMCSPRHPGTTCLSGLSRYEDPADIGNPRNNSKGCGGLMRVAPLGIFAHRMPDSNEKAIRWAAVNAAATHGHPLGYQTVGFLSSMIHHIMNDESLESSIKSAKTDCLRYDQGSADMIRIIEDAVELSRQLISDEEGMRFLGEGWVAEETLSMALFSCLRHADDPNGCLRCAGNITGDSDSVGSVAGNIIGAYLDIDALKEVFDTDKVECADSIRILAKDVT